MKTKRICAGYYSFEYKGFTGTISHTNDIPEFNIWFFEYTDLDGKFHKAEEVHTSKRIAIEAATEWIDYLTN